MRCHRHLRISTVSCTPSDLRVHRVPPVDGEVGIRPLEDACGADRAPEGWRRHLARVGLNIGQVNGLAKAMRGGADRSLAKRRTWRWTRCR